MTSAKKNQLEAIDTIKKSLQKKTSEKSTKIISKVSAEQILKDVLAPNTDAEMVHIMIKVFLKPLTDLDRNLMTATFNDFGFKFLRCVIDAIEKVSDSKIEALSLSCDTVLTALHLCFTLEKNVKPSNNEKVLKLLFHILKQVYKKSSLPCVLLISKCILKQLLFFRSQELNNDIKKFLYTSHQMCYALYVKNFREGKTDYNLFKLRAYSLLILSYSSWIEYKFIEVTKDFLLQWMKILYQKFSGAEFVLRALKKFLYSVNLLLENVTDKLDENNLIDLFWQIFVFAVRVLMHNQTDESIVEFVPTLIPVSQPELMQYIKIMRALFVMSKCFIQFPTCCSPNLLECQTFLLLFHEALNKMTRVDWLLDIVSVFSSYVKSVSCVQLVVILMDVLVSFLECSFLKSSCNDPNKVIFFSLSLIFQQTVKILIPSLREESSCPLKQDIKIRIELETKLDALVTVMSTKLNGLPFSKDECSWLSNITHRLSAYFYGINKFENALRLARFSVILFEDEDKDSLLLCLNECYSKLNNLIGCYTKNNLLTESYKYSLKLLSLLSKVKDVKEKLELIQAQVEYYIKIKMQLVQQGVQPTLIELCLFEELSGNHEQKDFWSEVLPMEYKALKRFASKLDIGIVLRKLVQLQISHYEELGDLLKYSMFLIELSTLPGSTREERSHWCKEALGMLEVMENDANCTGNNVDWHVKDLLAHAYFQSSIIQYEHKIMESNVLTVEKDFPEEEKDEDLVEKPFVVALNMAVELWSEILNEQLSRSDKIDLFVHAEQAAHCLYQASVLYSLLCQHFNAIKSAFFSGLIYELVFVHNQSMREKLQKLQANSWAYAVVQLVTVGELSQAELLLQKITSSEELTNVEIAKAAVMIRNGKIDSSIEILDRIIQKYKQCSSRTALLLKAEAYFMISCVKLASHKQKVYCYPENHIPIQSPFPPLKDCVKYLRTVYLASIGNESDISFSSVWEILDKLITCLVHNAELFKQQGYIPQAKALLKESLILSKKFHLSMRTVSIIQQIASLDLILQNKVSFEKNFTITKLFFKTSIGECFNGVDLYLPDFVNHDIDCSCSNCAYPTLQEICIRLFLQYMESRKQFDRQETSSESSQVIEKIIENASFRFNKMLASVKEIMTVEISTNAFTKKSKTLKSKDNSAGLFSKYFAEAKIIQPVVNVKSNLADTVEKLIKKVQNYYLSERVQHEYCRIIAQLYYLRNFLSVNEKLVSHTWSLPVETNVELSTNLQADEDEQILNSKQLQKNLKSKSKTPQRAIEHKRVSSKTNSVNEVEQQEKLGKSHKFRSHKQFKPENDLKKKPKKSTTLKENFDMTSFLNDMEKSLIMLNPYTDTLLIKSIYQLISLISGMTEKKLTLECQLLHQSRTLHQQVLNSISTKDISKKSIKKKCEDQLASVTCSLIEKYSAPDFVFSEENIQTLVDEHIPAGWAILNLSLSVSNSQSFLIISRVSACKSPVIIKIDISSSNEEKGGVRDVICDLAAAFDEDLFESFDSILANSKESMNIKNKSQWWNERLRLDKQMKNLVKRLEEEWLGGWRGIMLGNFYDNKLNKEIDQLTDEIMKNFKKELGLEVDPELLKLLVDGYTTCSKAKIKEALSYLLADKSDLGIEIMTEIIEEKRKGSKKRSPLDDFKKRNLVVLVLDKDLQRLPWESIPILRNQPVVRMPSLLLTAIHCMNNSGLLKDGLLCKNTFYILNPRNDLKNTEIKFSEWFQSEGWRGVVGQVPTKDQYKSALEENDLFIYCGHGSGQEYLGWDDIQQLHCRAVSLLMGCSSGKLQVHGYLEAYGMVLYYLLAGCPAVVANLWDVTDKDIDLFLEKLIKEWVTESSGESLAYCVSQSRESCNLEYLIGAAPVIYGLPLKIQSR